MCHGAAMCKSGFGCVGLEVNRGLEKCAVLWQEAVPPSWISDTNAGEGRFTDQFKAERWRRVIVLRLCIPAGVPDTERLTMAKKTPVQLVKDQFGSKAELAGRLAAVLNRPESETAEEFVVRLSKASNTQLLRLWSAEERAKSEFGGRAALVSAVVKFKFPFKGNAGFQAKLETYTTARLLHMHDVLKKASKG